MHLPLEQESNRFPMAITGNTAQPQPPAPSRPARVIAPGDHPITLDMIDRDALFVLRKLNGSGFSGYLVGGGVRDLYLGNIPKDYDIGTDARPGQIRKLFPNSATIGRRFRLVQVFFPHGKIIEISTLRSLSEHDLEGLEAVLAPNNTFGSLDEDAQRRDLTINSLFFEIEHCTIIDYVDGVKDLDDSIIRIVGDPEKRIIRDPVRMMRAIRHSARNNFRIEAETWQAICRNTSKLSLCPPSRLRDELFKDLYGGSAAGWFQLAAESGIFFSLFPIYRKILSDPLPNQPDYKDRLRKIMAVIDRLNGLMVEQKRPKLSPSFILALILVPWADSRYDLCRQNPKGHAIYQLSKKMRNDLDGMFGVHLNLRRSLRQEMATLLTNLPIFIQHRQNGTWPKWLRKKSYFRDSSFFFHAYEEAATEQPISDKTIDSFEMLQRSDKPDASDDKPHFRKSKPAFSSKRRGGIFGFKK